MSHFSLIKISIKNPILSLLKKAVEEIARELSAETVHQIHDYYGRARTDIVIGLKNNVFRRGVGLIITQDGLVQLVGDFYNIPVSEVERLKQMITQTYTALAISDCLTRLGYSVSAQKAQDKIYIMGVSP
jgi:hypothetical protein